MTELQKPYAHCFCDNCGTKMLAEWEHSELKEDGWMTYTVFHCENCDEDREVVRRFNNQGAVMFRDVRRYFFG